MNILHLAYSADVRSGWGRLTYEVITRLRERGHAINLLTEHASGYPEEKKLLGRSWRALTGLSQIRKHIRTADIVHSWEANPYAITAYAAGWGLKRKNVIIATGAYSVQPLYHIRTRAILKHVYPRTNRTICIVPTLKKRFSLCFLMTRLVGR